VKGLNEKNEEINTGNEIPGKGRKKEEKADLPSDGLVREADDVELQLA